MKKIFDIRHVVILILLLLMGLMFINPKGILPNRKELVIKTDSIPYAVHDTIPEEVEVEVEVEVPVEVEVEKRIEVPVIQPVDTTEILKIYFAKIQHKDVLTLPDNQGTISITDTISKNSIVNRKFIADVKKMIVKDTIYTPEPRKTQVYFGFDAKFDKPNVVNLMGLGVVLKTKDEKLYKIGVGMANNITDGTSGTLTPYLGGGVYWKVKLRR
jgi:hypothetical protein